jgi:hypothetical protein
VMGGGGRVTGLIGAGIGLRVAHRARMLADKDHWREQAAAIQCRQLSELLSRAEATRFGREHGFASLTKMSGSDLVSAYRKAVPLADWYAFKDQIARMREGGEPDVLWPGLVRDFAQTSGTTAGDKYIPVSKQMLRSNFRAALDIFATLVTWGVSLPRLTSGKCLFLGGSSDLKENEHGIRTGDLSGIVTPLIRWPLSTVYLPGKDIALMDHWPSKIDSMARRCVDQDVRMLNGMPSWAHVLMERMIEVAAERGRKVRCVRELWPNLEVFVHGGVKYGPFERRMRQIWSGDPDGDDFPVRLELYAASEAFVAIQDVRGDPGMRLLTDIGVFYEFVPLEEVDNPDAPAFTCDQVEKGQRYVVVLTTCAGLWRYILGDVVEFDTIPGGLDGRGGDGPPRLRIVGRHRHFINAFGENLIVEQVEDAVAAAARETGLTVGEFTAAPVYPGEGVPAGLELVVEIGGEAMGPWGDEGGHEGDGRRGGGGWLGAFRDAFDAALKARNVDYTTKRTSDLGMGPPTITPVPAGTFHRWLESKGKLGGQHKCPRCANHREILEAVLSVAEIAR